MRRGLGIYLLVLLVVAIDVNGQESKAPMTDESQAPKARPAYFMFIQTAGSGSFTPLKGVEGRYLVDFENVNPMTIYFSDRPARLSGHVPMQKFLDGLGFTELNPPNAAIEVQTGDGESVVVVAELLSPRWDGETKLLSYHIRVLEDQTDGGLAQYNDSKKTTLPSTFGGAAIFIDDCPDKVVYCFARASIGWGGGCVDPTWDADPTLFCGQLPGKAGTCWNWATAACRFCQNHYEDCDAAFPNCSTGCGHTFSESQSGSHAGEKAN